MSINQSNIIDAISTTPEDKIVLTISDHHLWNESSHLAILQDKINSYLQFIESEQIFQDYPNAIGKKIIIETVMKFKPTEEAIHYLKQAKEIIVDAGFDFSWRVLRFT